MRSSREGRIVRSSVAQVIAFLLAWPFSIAGQQPAPPAQPSAPAQAPAPGPTKPMAPLPMVSGLKVVALAGNGESNDLERHVMAPLVVQVTDQNDHPVEGAEVVFRFPLSGPGATFADQKTARTVRTNGQGQAAATGWTANSELGKFDVHVTATYGNQIGEVTISMINAARVTRTTRLHGKRKGLLSSKWVRIGLVAVAAGAVAGIVLATRGGSSSGHTITVSPGSPTVGAPH